MHVAEFSHLLWGYMSILHVYISVVILILRPMFAMFCMSPLCFISQGCGKTSLVNQFASMLGYVSENVVLYRDMTSHELLQQRTTMTNGDTTWTQLPLVAAAREGHMAILDGIHQL